MAFSDLYGSGVRGLLRLTTVTALGLSMAACVGSDESYFDDGSSAQMQEGQPLFHRLLSGTIVDPPKAQIEYTARAPLVVPPSQSDLPAPQTASAKEGVAWPKDQDESAAALALARSKVNPGDAVRDRNRPGERLKADEIVEGRIAGGGIDGRTTSRDYRTVESTSHERMGDRLTPEQLAQKPALPTSKTEINAAPVRKYLIEPPSDYRTPATTAAMPEVDSASRDAPSTSYDPKRSRLENIPGVTNN